MSTCQKPLSIFSAMFLHYQPIKEPTELNAKTILYKQTSTFRTSVNVILYPRGFYIKGKLNHVSFEERKCKSYQFICAGLLKNAFKIQFRDEFVLVIFHETIELVNEAMLLSFSTDSVVYCDNFLQYLHTLISEKVCNETFQDSVENEPIDRLVPNHMSESDSKPIITPMNEIQNISHKKSELQFSSDTSNSTSSNDKEQGNSPKEKILESDSKPIITPLNQIQNISHKKSELQNSSDISNSTSSNDKEQGNSPKEPIGINEALSFFSKIKQFLERPGDMEEIIEAKAEKISSNEIFDEMIKDYDIVSVAEVEMSSNAPFYKENKLLAELMEIENEKSLKTFSQNLNIDKLIKAQTRSMSNENRMLVWPEFLETEINFTSSLLVEMSSMNRRCLTGNWSLTDKFRKNSSSSENKHFFQLEWDERVDRLLYNRYKKSFQIDKNGSILLYCCRQVSKNDVLN